MNDDVIYFERWDLGFLHVRQVMRLSALSFYYYAIEARRQ